ncbi:unnamed protein product [Somion occarium]|uniref:Uncharacterized protein n=1 Tax=Somion occarium TaxID=3059160 RepID=A0ABP1CRU6_9APHY
MWLFRILRIRHKSRLRILEPFLASSPVSYYLHQRTPLSKGLISLPVASFKYRSFRYVLHPYTMHECHIHNVYTGFSFTFPLQG